VRFHHGRKSISNAKSVNDRFFALSWMTILFCQEESKTIRFYHHVVLVAVGHSFLILNILCIENLTLVIVFRFDVVL